MGDGNTSIVELTLATSDRPGFGFVLMACSVVRPMVEWATRRLWNDDRAYAERMAWLRSRSRAGST